MAERVSRRSFIGVAGAAAVGARPSAGTDASRDPSSPFRPRSLSFCAIDKRGGLGVPPLFRARYASHPGGTAALRDTAHLCESPT